MSTNNTGILAQKRPSPKLTWALALTALPFFSVAAFGIAPQTRTDNIEIRNVVEKLPLPADMQPLTVSDTYWNEERIQRSDTLANVLSRLGVSDPDAINFLRNSKDTQPLHQLRPGKSLQAQITATGELVSLRFLDNNGNVLSVEKNGADFKVHEQAPPLESRMTIKSGEIKSSLYAATDAANIPDNIANQLADIFSSDIDFHRDLRRGDKFTVIYETFYDKGELIKTGRVLATEFINQGDTYQALYFKEEPDHIGGYYTPDGKSLRKAFLRSPLEFSRISSGFSLSRFHPVLQTWRSHKGVDYAAPIGTRVRSTANGTVSFIGRQGGYGNVVILQHPNNYSTVYGHLSGFAKGLHRGDRVSQGELIGYVGKTGLATGPHLHYEFRVSGVQRDPLRVVMPPAPPITAQLKALFEKSAQPMVQQLTLLRDTNLARFD